jgi:isocitrate dehydrogenase
MGSKADEYAQLLMTIFSHIKEDIYNLIEKAENERKKLEVLDLTENGTILRDEIQITDIVLV